MSKAVLISIKPEWCRLIASGTKTIEVRKTKPQIDTPFKCYIYQTLPKYGDWNERDGHVIGEFICDVIYTVKVERGYTLSESIIGIPILRFFHDSHMTPYDLLDYLDIGHHEYKTGYGWHISDLFIYGKPKQLREFYKWFDGANDIRPCQNGNDCKHLYYDYSEGCQACVIDFDGTDCPYYKVRKAPQSWMYVEEL